MSDLIKKTAKAAGKWWADLLCEEHADKRESLDEKARIERDARNRL